MTNLNVHIENCYGIKKFKKDFNFTDEQNTYLIYAPNGTMKTSLTKVFEKYSLDKKNEIKKYMFGDEKIHSINLDGIEIQNDSICVIKSESDHEYTSANIELLLGGEKEKTEIKQIWTEITEDETNFLNKIKGVSGAKRSDNIKDVFTGIDNIKNKDFYRILGSYKHEVERNGEEYSDYSDYETFKIFNKKTEALFSDSDFIEGLKSYIEKYDEVLSTSVFFSKENKFLIHNANTVQSVIDKNNFLRVPNKIIIVLKNGKEREINTDDELRECIDEELNLINNDAGLKKEFENFEKKYFGNEDYKALREYITSRKEILEELLNVKEFKRKLWTSYFVKYSEEFINLVNKYYDSVDKIKKIKDEIQEDKNKWHLAKEIFLERFKPPFHIEIENCVDIISGDNDFESFTFYYQNPLDKNEKTKITKTELTKDILSRGERRSLYLMNMIFDIEAKKEQESNTLVIVDDIADSFDYANKYAIIEYLNDIRKNNKFKMLILTHNFDFYRVVAKRLEILTEYRTTAVKNHSNNIELMPGLCVDNIFDDWKMGLKQGNLSKTKCLALIPFLRNLSEYNYSSGSSEYDFLTNFLHHKDNTENLTIANLDDFIKQKFKALNPENRDISSSLDEKYLDTLFSAADSISTNEGIKLEDKIVLAIAIRLKSEKFIKN